MIPRAHPSRRASTLIAALAMVVSGHVAHAGAVGPEADTSSPVEKRYALIVGTDRYDDEAWKDLARPRADASLIAAELHDRYGFELVPVPPNPTLAEFDAALIEAKRRTQERDDLVVFIAGHGYYDEAGAQGYIVLRDSPPPERCRTGGCYPLATVRTTLETAAARHVLVLIDACHGGTFEEELATRGRDVDSAAALRDYARYRSRLVLTSGGNVRVADESAYAAALLDTLRKPGADGLVTYEQLVAAVSGLPTRPTWGAFTGSKRHQPGGTFLFVAEPVPPAPTASPGPSLTPVVSERGATIAIDGRLLGQSPVPAIALAPGPHVLVAEKDGFHPVHHQLEVPAHGATRVTVTMRRDTTDLAVAGWVTLGIGAALAAGGGVSLWAGEQDHREITEAEGYDEGELVSLTQAEAASLRESGDDKKLAGWVLLGTGGAALATALLLLVLADEDEPGTVVVTPAVALSPGGGGLRLQGSF